MLYLEECYHQIDLAEHPLEVQSLRFFGAGAESAAIEVIALIDWAEEFLTLSHSPIPEIPAFLRRPFVMGKNVKYPVPEDPGDAILKEKCVLTKAQRSWVYLCVLLQFWTDEAMTESSEVMYRGRRRPANPMIMQIRAMVNPSFGEHFQITWASIAVSTSWTYAHLYYGAEQRECFRSEPGPTPDMQNPLEAAVEQRWEKYVQDGVQETSDLSFTTLSWAGVAGMLHLPSGPLEARHPTEVESMPPGFTCVHRKMQEEEEVVVRYEIPSEAELKQSIDEELGIQDITTINESWYRMESEVMSAMGSILDESQPMEMDQTPAENSYRMFQDDAPGLLGPGRGSDSPMTASKDQVLDMPASFSWAPGDGRPPTTSLAGTPGRKITGHTKEGPVP